MSRRGLASAAAAAVVLFAAGAIAADEVAVPPLKARVTDPETYMRPSGPKTTVRVQCPPPEGRRASAVPRVAFMVAGS